MLDGVTPLRSAAMKLKSPMSPDFDPDAWRGATSLDVESDAYLLLAALWFGHEAGALRQTTTKSALAALGPAMSTILAMAVANREYRMVQRLSEARSEGRTEVAFSAHVDAPVLRNLDGQEASADEFAEILVDASESWLYDAARSEGFGETGGRDLTSLAICGGQIYSIQRTLNDFWQQARWEDWRIGARGEGLTWSPGDRDHAARLHAWQHRAEENAGAHAILLLGDWCAMSVGERRKHYLPRTVCGIEVRRGRRFLVVEKPIVHSRAPPLFALDSIVLENSYLGPLIDRPLETHPRLSCRILLRAWHVIGDLARRLAKMTPLPETIDVAAARSLATVVERAELADVLRRALCLDDDDVNGLIELLTFRTAVAGGRAQRGLWGAPLVPIPGEDRYALCQAVLACSAPIWKGEAWLERGGVNDLLSKDARGQSLERQLRSRLRARAAANATLSSLVVAEHQIAKSKDFPEEIDLVFRLGRWLFVGEVKHLLFPGSSQERFNYYDKLRKAAKQAKRKAAAARDKPAIVAKALGLDNDTVENLEVVPLIVVNQGFGFGQIVDECQVTEAGFLEHLLGDPILATDAALDTTTGKRVTRTIRLYRDEADAEANIRAILADPPTLRRHLDRIAWREVQFPTATRRRFDVTLPYVADVSGLARFEALHLQGQLQSRVSRRR
ncbi:MAG: hypothetical protein ACJ798_02720 [Phenylobacterium sp.]